MVNKNLKQNKKINWIIIFASLFLVAAIISLSFLANDNNRAKEQPQISDTVSSEPQSDDFIFMESILYGGARLFQYKGVSKEVIVPESYNGMPVTRVAADAFRGNKYITSVVFPKNLESIGTDALRDCPNLASVSLPKDLKLLSSYVFYNCVSLESIELPDGMEIIDEYLFCGCKGLESITLPKCLKSIGKSAFSGCVALTEISLPDGLTSIDEYAFFNCTGLTEITIPKTVTEIDYLAFYECNNLTEIKAYYPLDYYASPSLPEGCSWMVLD